MGAPILEFANVSKKFRRGELHDSLRDLLPSLASSVWHRKGPTELGQREFWALRDVSFSVDRGEALAIIGPNGAGKSTALKILVGIMNPTSGTTSVRGTLSALIDVGAGFHPDLTGRENIFLNGAILGMSRRQIQGRLEEIIEFSGLRKFIDTPVKRYSSGMYARLGFSIACHVAPDVLVVDEVLSVGDWNFQSKSLAKMKSILEGGATVIFVSHNLRAVVELCDRAIYLDEGQVQATGRPAEVVERYVRRAAAEAQMPCVEDKDASIDRVMVRGVNGESSIFQPGEKAFVDVTISAVTPDEPFTVALSLRDESDNHFFYVDSAALAGQPLHLVPGQPKTITFELAMHLGPGSYYLNVGLVQLARNRTVDQRRMARRFVVHSDAHVQGVANLYPQLISS
jgi:ABC-type polysaccharide/polyol phosphate transport system ATPase subunit